MERRWKLLALVQTYLCIHVESLLSRINPAGSEIEINGAIYSVKYKILARKII